MRNQAAAFPCKLDERNSDLPEEADSLPLQTVQGKKPDLSRPVCCIFSTDDI